MNRIPIMLLIYCLLFHIGCAVTFLEKSYQKGNDYLNAEQYDKAIIEYEKALSETKDNGAIMAFATNVGIAYHKLGNYYKATEYYTRSIEAMPERGYYGYINLASLNYENGNIGKAYYFSSKAKELVTSPRYNEIEKRSQFAINTIKYLVVAENEFYKMRLDFKNLCKEYELKNYQESIRIADEILKTKYHTHFGVSYANNTITDVQDGSIADLNGLVKGDKIVEIDGKTIASMTEAYNVTNEYFDKYGTTISLKIIRKGREIPIVCRLIYPELEQTKSILQEAKNKLPLGATETAKGSRGPWLKIMEPKTGRGLKIVDNQIASFVILASGMDDIYKVTVNDIVCAPSEADVLEQTFLPGKVKKYSTTMPLVQSKNKFIVQAVDIKGNKAQEQIEIEGNQSHVKEFDKIYTHKVAVVIGINRYSTFNSLEFAVNDAKAVRDRLVKQGFDKIIEVYDGEATRARIMRILGDELPSTMGKNDALMVYFAGHGLTEDLPDGGKEGYLAPVDTNVDNFRGTAISMTYIHDMIKKYRAKHILFLFDSCYSGLGLKRAGSVDKKVSSFIRNASQKSATQIITAGGKDEQAREIKGHGVFTQSLLDVLDSKPDEAGDGYIVASDVASTIRKKVTDITNGAQNPVFGWLAGEGDFIFETF